MYLGIDLGCSFIKTTRPHRIKNKIKDVLHVLRPQLVMLTDALLFLLLVQRQTILCLCIMHFLVVALFMSFFHQEMVKKKSVILNHLRKDSFSN